MARQVDPEWDDNDRTLAEGLDRYDAECCPGCGMHPVILDDPEHNVFALDDKVCRMCAGQQIHGRALAQDDEGWDKRNPNAKVTEPRPGDGRHTYLRPMNPEEIEQARTRRSGSGQPQRPAGPTRSR